MRQIRASGDMAALQHCAVALDYAIGASDVASAPLYYRVG